MDQIKILDKSTIDRIAAGEVVERPASVLKELAENAIDAGAAAVTIEIKDGGISLIRVTDNGRGIESSQVRTAFLRHATSKINDVNDLNRIATLGFRGEALSSIAAVSMCELITRPKDALTGTRYLIEGGKEILFEEVGAPYGTTFIMRNLFFNTPARAKFLKTPHSEANAAAEYVEELALSHPEISFNFISNGANRLYTSGSGRLLECAYNVYGKDVIKELIPVDVRTEYMHVSGYIGKSTLSRGNRSFETFFVNGRLVKSKILSSAAEEGYHGSLMQHRYPFLLLNIGVDLDKVDVNVHPAKLEVRFSSAQQIYDELRRIIKEAVDSSKDIPVVNEKEKANETAEQKPVYVPEPFEQGRQAFQENTADDFDRKLRRSAFSSHAAADSRISRPDNTEPLSSDRRMPEFVKERTASWETGAEKTADIKPDPRPDNIPDIKPEQLVLFDDVHLAKQDLEQVRIIGQAFDTYILAEKGDMFLLIDQHAAHEKVNYEKFLKEFEQRRVMIQQLAPSVMLSLTPAQAELIDSHIDDFTSCGFELEAFGGREYKITGVPVQFAKVNVKELFKEILDTMGELRNDTPRLVLDTIATKACKASVKANMHLSREEINALIEKLMECEDPYNCPHGRPAIISFTRRELDKKFKRIV